MRMVQKLLQFLSLVQLMLVVMDRIILPHQQHLICQQFHVHNYVLKLAVLGVPRKVFM